MLVELKLVDNTGQCYAVSPAHWSQGVRLVSCQAEWSSLIGPESSRYSPLIGPESSRYSPLIGPESSTYTPLIGGHGHHAMSF